jgi:hypothetical protein
MDEVSNLNQKAEKGLSHLRGISGDTFGQVVWELLGSLRLPERNNPREVSPYKETKWEIAIKVADDIVVLKMIVQHNAAKLQTKMNLEQGTPINDFRSKKKS